MLSTYRFELSRVRTDPPCGCRAERHHSLVCVQPSLSVVTWHRKPTSATLSYLYPFFRFPYVAWAHRCVSHKSYAVSRDVHIYIYIEMIIIRDIIVFPNKEKAILTLNRLQKLFFFLSERRWHPCELICDLCSCRPV